MSGGELSDDDTNLEEKGKSSKSKLNESEKLEDFLNEPNGK